MRSTQDARLRRLEAAHAPAMPMSALLVEASSPEDAEAQLAEAVAAGRHRRGWPAIVLTVSRPQPEGDPR